MDKVIQFPHKSISQKKMRSILNCPKKTAAAVNLAYVNASEPGILRIKRGDEFVYIYKKRPVTAKKHLERIRRLVIPPAWEDVWICRLAHGHLQCTGIDKKRRKQYKYHALWNSLRNQTKFYRLYDFG